MGTRTAPWLVMGLLGGGSALAALGDTTAPSPISTTQQLVQAVTAPTNCASRPPDATNCADQVWQRYCSGLFANSAAACNSANQFLMSTYFSRRPTGDRTFDPDSESFLPAASSALKRPTSETGTRTTWASREEEARMVALKSAIVDPNAWVRMPDVAEGTAMTSCENYVYRRFYDVERWIDAMNACKGDEGCIVDVSFHGVVGRGQATVPGIARREMLDVKARPISERLSVLVAAEKIPTYEADPFTGAYRLDVTPKNAFYATTEMLITPRLIDAFTQAGKGAEVQAMLNELHRGATMYVSEGAQRSGGNPWVDAAGVAHRGFYDEWEFHQYLRGRNTALTPGEAREYRRRTTKVVEQLNMLIDSSLCLIPSINPTGGPCNHKNLPNALGKVNPGDTQMWENDPFATLRILGQLTADNIVAPPSMTGQLGFGLELQPALSTSAQFSGVALPSAVAMPMSAHLPGVTMLSFAKNPSLLLSRIGPTTSVTSTYVNIDDPAPPFAASTKLSRWNLKGLIDELWNTRAPVIDVTHAYPRLKCTSLRDSRAPATASDLAQEDACVVIDTLLQEWERYRLGRPSCLNPKSAACDWQPRDFIDRFVTQFIGYGNSAKEAEYRNCRRWTGGDQLASSTALGISWYSRRYLDGVSYQLDQREAAFNQAMKNVPVKADDNFGTYKHQREQIGNAEFGGEYSYSLGWNAKVQQRDRGGNICRMGGRITAAFNADAVLFGHSFDIIDVASVVDANGSDTGQAYGSGHVFVGGNQLFDTGGNVNISGAYSLMELESDDITLFEVPFQAGPVTITVSGGVSYGYGLMGMMAAAPAAQNSCSTTPVFKAQSMFVPSANLGVWADADCSLAGIAGVGLEVNLTLVQLGLPLITSLAVNPATQPAKLSFDAGLNLTVTTLKGDLSVYIKALFMKVASFSILDWNGFTYTIPIFRTPPTSFYLTEFPAGSIKPPPVGSDSP